MWKIHCPLSFSKTGSEERGGEKRNFEGGEVESGPLKDCKDGRLEEEMIPGERRRANENGEQ